MIADRSWSRACVVTSLKGNLNGGSERLASRLLGVLRGDQAAGLVVDLYRDLGERVGVLPVVMGAEQQFRRAREDNSGIALRRATIAERRGGERRRRSPPASNGT